MKILLILLTLISTKIQANEDFIPYLQSFYDAAISSKTLDKNHLKRLNSMKVRYATIDEIPDYFIGICDVKNNVVLVNQDSYNQLSKSKKQWFFDHELGHCVLLRSHYNVSTMTYKGEIPEDIMHHSIHEYSSKSHMNDMRKALFNPKFYGTQLELASQYEVPKDELIVSSNPLISMGSNVNSLRMLEHRIMQERIERYQKQK